MDSKRYQAIYQVAQEILETKLGNFYYKAKLGKEPEPKNLIIKLKGPKGNFLSPDLSLGTLSSFIDNIKKKQESNGDIPFINLIKSIKKLSQDNDATTVEIMGVIMSLPSSIEAEKHRKKYYDKLNKKEYQSHERKKKKQLAEYEKAIEIVKELDPTINEDSYKTLAQEKVKNLEPSVTLSQLREIHKRGLMWATEKTQKSTKGLQSLRGCILGIYRSSKSKQTKLSNNAIYVEIAKILNNIGINTSNGKKYTRENIREYIERNIPG